MSGQTDAIYADMSEAHRSVTDALTDMSGIEQDAGRAWGTAAVEELAREAVEALEALGRRAERSTRGHAH